MNNKTDHLLLAIYNCGELELTKKTLWASLSTTNRRAAVLFLFVCFVFVFVFFCLFFCFFFCLFFLQSIALSCLLTFRNAV